MSRITLIRDTQGEKQLHPQDYPLSVGGPDSALPIPGVDRNLAYIGLEEGHAFIQSIDGKTAVWHNHERLNGSAWLKSGDQLQFDMSILLWQVQGDQITISITEADPTPVTPQTLTPPPSPPPQSIPNIPLEPHPSRKGRRGVRWALFAAFGLLLLVAAFVILSSPITLEIEPQPVDLALEGFPLAVRLQDRALALPGQYKLRASRPGYLERIETIDVRFGQPRTIAFALAKAPGRLTVASTPAGARLYVDAQARGSTPVQNLELTPGVHRIRLEAPHHLPVEQDLEIIGMGRAQKLALTLAPNSAPVGFQSLPPGAEVTLDGRSLGITPVTVELDSGKHQPTIAKPGYKPVTIQVQVAASEPQQLPTINLEPLDGFLGLVTNPEGAIVTVDDKYLGRAPMDLHLVPGVRHRLRITKTGFAPHEQSVELASEERRELSIHLKPEYGIVFLTTQPADAKLFIDGKHKGAAVTRLRLTTLPHRIEIRKTGYTPYRGSITPRKGISQNLEIVLKPDATHTATGKTSANALTTGSGQILKRVQPKGGVTLGASRREPGRRSNENIRKIQLSQPYFIGIREVTNAEFRRFRPSHDSGTLGGFNLNQDDQPVVNISWDDTARYLNWLSTQDGLPTTYEEVNGTMTLIRPVTSGYRLPTEAEWAYAARFAGREQPAQYPWGERRFPPPRVQGNYADTSSQPLLQVNIEAYDDGQAVSAPVGGYEPNPIGLFDLDGNVAEWCLDYYAVYPGTANKLVTDPLGPETGRHHVVRGSSWRDASLSELRLSYRDYAEKPRNDLGFRIARYVR